MPRSHSRRRPQMIPLVLRFFLILLFAAVAIYAGYQLWGLPGMLIAPVFAVGITQILIQRKNPA